MTNTPSASTKPKVETSHSTSASKQVKSTTAKPVGCTPNQLSGKLLGGQGGGGTAYYDFELVNTSRISCTLKGYPKVDVVGQNRGKKIGHTLAHQYWPYKINSTEIPQLTLKPGQKAYSQLAQPSVYSYSTDKSQPATVYSGHYNKTCGKVVKADGYRIYLPGESTSLYVAIKGGFPTCSATKKAIGRVSEFLNKRTSV